MEIIKEQDETLMSIFAETEGRFGLDPDSGWPGANCVFAGLLSQAVYTSAALDSADGGDVPPLEYLYRLVYPKRGQQQAISKMQPDCLKLSPIIQEWKFEITETAANNVIDKEDKKAPNTSFIHGEVGDFERLAQEVVPNAHKPNGWMWKRESYPAAAKSLEWIQWADS